MRLFLVPLRFPYILIPSLSRDEDARHQCNQCNSYRSAASGAGWRTTDAAVIGIAKGTRAGLNRAKEVRNAHAR